MAVGAAMWGLVAEYIGLRNAFIAAFVFGVAMPLATARLKLVEQLDEDRPAVADQPTPS
jgi:hypothetical protein